MSSPALAPLSVLPVPVRPRIVPDREPEIFDRLSPRWTCIERVPFGDTVEIGHVLLSAAGVFVLETGSSSSPDLRHAISETRWRARKIAFLLDRVGRPRVTPVLVVSGPVMPAIAGGCEMIDGVLVCSGADAAPWLAYLEGLPATIEPECIDEMVDILVDHTLRTDEVNRTFA